MTDDQIRAAAEEIHAHVQRPSFGETLDIIRRHATAETVSIEACPCGNDAEVIDVSRSDKHGMCVRCLSGFMCWIGKEFPTEAEAIAEWNRVVRAVRGAKLPAAARCHVCKAAVGEPHAGHCSVSPGVMVDKLAPQPVGDGVEVRAADKSLLDEFAMAAMCKCLQKSDLTGSSDLWSDFAEQVWAIARHMLETRPMPQVPTVEAKVEGVSQ